MKIPFLDLKRQPGDVYASVQRVFHRGWFINGPELESWEAQFAAYCGAKHCVGVGNGTDAIELALRSIGTGPGDEVVTVANAGMYATTAIRAIGATPLFVDIDPCSLLMSPEALSASIRPSTRAVVVTHLYGLLAPMNAIEQVTRQFGIPIIEDCAQAHGASRDGRKAGTWGVAGCFSFFPTKNLGAAGDAGAVITSNPDISARVRALRQYGWTSRFSSSVSGGRNSRLDEVQAAILSAKLAYLDDGNRRRREIAQKYSRGLAGSNILPQVATPGEDYVGHLYVIQSRFRDAIQRGLTMRGVETSIHYPVPDHLQASQVSLAYRAHSLDETEAAAKRVLSLPCYPELTDLEADFIQQSLSDIHHELL